MELFRISIIILIGLVIIIFGGNALVNSAINLSKLTKIPEALIGATLISLATTLPELSVTVFSSIENANSLAIGNAIGSMVFNLTLIIGICILFCPQQIDSKELKKNFVFLIMCLILIFILGIFNGFNLFYGIILLLMCGYYLLSNVLIAKHKITVEKIVIEKIKFSKKNALKLIVKLFLSSILVLIGAKILTDGCLKIASSLNISHTIVGVSIIALGTSLPELVTAISSIKKKATSIAIGNIIGANVLSCTLLMGATTTLSGGYVVMDNNITFIAIPLSLLSLTILFLPIKHNNATKRWQGVTLIMLGILYYFLLFRHI